MLNKSCYSYTGIYRYMKYHCIDCFSSRGRWRTFRLMYEGMHLPCTTYPDAQKWKKKPVFRMCWTNMVQTGTCRHLRVHHDTHTQRSQPLFSSNQALTALRGWRVSQPPSLCHGYWTWIMTGICLLFPFRVTWWLVPDVKAPATRSGHEIDDFFATECAFLPQSIVCPFFFNEGGRIKKNRPSKLHYRFQRSTSLIKCVFLESQILNAYGAMMEFFNIWPEK